MFEHQTWNSKSESFFKVLRSKPNVIGGKYERFLSLLENLQFLLFALRQLRGLLIDKITDKQLNDRCVTRTSDSP